MTNLPSTEKKRPRLYKLGGFLLLLLTLVLPAGLLASPLPRAAQELPEKYRTWLEKDVVYIISDRERGAFLDLESVGEWEAFIDTFWRRRDPDPLTPTNEFKDEHYRRLAYANGQLGRESAVPGWMTDRGKMYIILGEPRDRESFLAVPFLYASEVWFYPPDRDKGLPALNLLFFRDGFAASYRLFNHGLDGPGTLMPGERFDGESYRLDAYRMLQEISPELAHATITMRAGQGAYAGIVQSARSALDTQVLLSDIQLSAYRRVDTRYVNAAREARGLVESEYLFNYVPSHGIANVIPGPANSSFVHYSIELEPQHLTLAKEDNAYYTTFELQGEVTAENSEEVVLQFSKEPYLQLTESQLQGVMHRPFAYQDMFALVSGEYRFRLVLKNRARSEYTIFETPLLVRDRSGEAVYLGKPVLLYAAGKETSPEAPLTYGTYQVGPLMLEPNAKHVYAIGNNLLAHVPLENASDQYQLSLRLVNREEVAKVMVSKVTPVKTYQGALVLETLSLEGADGGRYRLLVDLLDSSGQAIASRWEDFDITPRNAVQRPWVLRENTDGQKEGLIRVELAKQHLQKGQTQRAMELCEQAIRDDPSLLTPRLLLARFHLDEARPKEAAELLEPVQPRHEDNVAVSLTLGDAYLQAGNYPRAVELFESTLILRRPTSYLLNALAMSHTRLGNYDKAVEYLESSLELDPKQESVKGLLKDLQSATPPPFR